MIEPLYERRRKAGFSLSDVPKATFVMAVAMLIVMFGIWSLSKPSDAKQRLAALDSQAKTIKTATRTEGDLQTYPLGSVCTEDLDDGFKNRLNTALMNSGLKVEALDISDAGQAGSIHPLRGYTLSLKGSGSYEQAVGAMQVLAQYRPKVFLDSMSLRNQTSSVDLNVEGRLYCRWKKQG